MTDAFGGYNVDWSGGSEEPWEKQIASLLGSLPPVEPPPGFLENLVASGPEIRGAFALDGDSAFAFPVLEVDQDD